MGAKSSLCKKQANLLHQIQAPRAGSPVCQTRTWSACTQRSVAGPKMWFRGPGSRTVGLCSTAPPVHPKLSSPSPQLAQNAMNSFRSWDVYIMHWSVLPGTFESPFNRVLSDGLGIRINFSWVREGVSENLGSSPSFCLCREDLGAFAFFLLLLLFFWWLVGVFRS